MDTIGLVIELLKQKAFITPLEQDILDTYHELNQESFVTPARLSQMSLK